MKPCVLLLCIAVCWLSVVAGVSAQLPSIPMTLSLRFDLDASSGVVIDCTVSNSGGTAIAQLLSARKWSSTEWLNATDVALITAPANPGMWPCPGTWDSNCQRFWIAEPITLGCSITNHDTASYNYFTFKLHPSPSWNGSYEAGWTAADENYAQSCNSQPCDALGCFSSRTHPVPGRRLMPADAADGYVIPGLLELVTPLAVPNEVYFLQQYRYIHPNIFYIQIYAQ